MANQGIYHPTYNPNGSKKLSDGNFWYNTSVSINSTMDCFDSSKMLAASGNIGTTSGRPDGTFYDQIVENSILDLRNSSKKVEDYNRLTSREFNKLVAGTNRGKEGEWMTLRKIPVTVAGSDLRISGGFSSYFGYLVNVSDFTTIKTVEPRFWCFNLTKGTDITNSVYKFGTNLIIYGSNGTDYVNDTIIMYNYSSYQTTRTKSNTLLHCDIIGNPTNYPTSWKQSGVFGTPLIVAEDGTSLLPDGAKDTFKLSRKANATPLLCLRSTDSGATWASFTPTFNTTTNAITLTDEPAGNLVLVYYQTHTSMAVPAGVGEVLEIGGIHACNEAVSNRGAYLVNTLINKVTTFANSSTQKSSVKLNFIESPIYNASNYLIGNGGYGYNPNHSSISLDGGGIGVPAVKVFPYLTRLNGKAYLNLMFKEMKYGSYLAPTTVTAASATYTQNLTYKINIAGCALDGKVIKWVGTTVTSAIDWSLYDVSPTGVIYLLSTGVVYTNAKLYDGDSWGDDSKFNIVDNVSTTTDDNGQTVLIGQKTVELPYFIGADE